MATQVADTSTEAPVESGKVNRQQQRRAFPIIDTDVHHTYPDKSDLYPYMTRYYAERFADYGTGISAGHANNGGFRGRRADTIDVDVPQPANIGTSAIADRWAGGFGQRHDGSRLRLCHLPGIQ